MTPPPSPPDRHALRVAAPQAGWWEGWHRHRANSGAGGSAGMGAVPESEAGQLWAGLSSQDAMQRNATMWQHSTHLRA